MQVTAAMVKEVRERSGAAMMECKKALVETAGDVEAALDHLRKSGAAKAAKKAGRIAADGAIIALVDGNQGVIVEVNSETDFVAKTDDFQEFAKNIAMHIAAANPVSIVPEDVPEEIINKEMEIYRAQAQEMGKPEKMLDKIAEGKLNKFFKDSCLMNQAYVRDPDKTVDDILKEVIAKTGENITINRFVRFQIGG